MKKQNNKGFTLVELVIVIAVIAILAGVLIGTFASVISRANQSKALQVEKAAFDEKWVEFVADEHEIPTWITVDENGVKLYNDKSTFTAEASVVVEGFDVENAEKANKSYYAIKDINDLYTFAELWNKGEGIHINRVKFTGNIELDFSDRAWSPIGTWEYPYHGEIDGMGSTIKMFGNVDKASQEVMGTSGSQTGITGYAFGLIGIAGGGDVKVSNINFVDLAINYAYRNMVAAVIGFAPSNSKFMMMVKSY